MMAQRPVAPLMHFNASNINTMIQHDDEKISPYIVPLYCDILCGRSRIAAHNGGNQKFRMAIALNLKRYIQAPTRDAKTQVIESIVNMVLQEMGARFLKQSDRNNNLYQELDRGEARAKVAHALRDMALKKKRCEGGRDATSKRNSAAAATTLSNTRTVQSVANRQDGIILLEDEDYIKRLASIGCLTADDEDEMKRLLEPRPLPPNTFFRSNGATKPNYSTSHF
jgi:hypothetical protein